MNARLTLLVLAAAGCAAASHGTAEQWTETMAVNRALEVADSRRAADERLNAAAAQVDKADAERLPLVSAAATAGRRSSVPEFTLPSAVTGSQALILAPSITATGTAGIRMEQPLYTGGAITALRQLRRHELDAAGADLDRVTADVRLAARLAYWEAVESKAALASSIAHLHRTQRLLEDTEALLHAGMAVEADLLTARERLAAAEFLRIRAGIDLSRAMAALRSLLQLAGTAPLELAVDLDAGMPQRPGSLQELSAAAEAHRPESAAARARTGGLATGIRAASAATRPILGLSAQWETARPNPRYFPVQGTWRDSWSLGVQATWVVADCGRRRHGEAAARAEHRASRSDQDELARRIALEVEDARLHLEGALAAVAASDAALRAAVERERGARELYEAGMAPLADLLDGLASLASAERDSVASRAAAWKAAALLDRVVGR